MHTNALCRSKKTSLEEQNSISGVLIYIYLLKIITYLHSVMAAIAQHWPILSFIFEAQFKEKLKIAIIRDTWK